jgi:hypothetical protein
MMTDLETYLYFRRMIEPSFYSGREMVDEADEDEEESASPDEPEAEAGDIGFDVAEHYRAGLAGESAPADDDFWPDFFERMQQVFPLHGGNPYAYRPKRRRSWIS